MNTYFIFLFLILYSKTYSLELISSAAELDREGIAELLNDETWINVLNRSILYNVKYHDLQANTDDTDNTTNKKEDLNVLSVLKKYIKDGSRDKEVSIDVVRALVQDAANCAGLTNTNLLVMLFLKDLLVYLDTVLDENEPPTNNDEGCKHTDKTMRCTKLYDEHHMNFDMITEDCRIELKGLGDSRKNKLKIDSMWKNIIRKRATLDIEYRIVRGRFFSADSIIKPVIKDLYEIIFTLSITWKITNEKLEKTCVAHGGSYIKKYESLYKELGQEFVQFIKDIDEKQYPGSNGELYSNSDGISSVIDSMMVVFEPNKANVNPYDPFILQHANFEDINSTVYLDIMPHKDVDETSSFEAATIRKLSLRIPFENNSDVEDSDQEESNTNDPDGENARDSYYYFKDTVKVSLS